MQYTHIAEYILENYSEKVVEVGIGRMHELAKTLSDKGLKVIATDIIDLGPISDFEYVKDDIFNPDINIYSGASLIYSIRPPIELFSPIKAVSSIVKADCLIRPLSNEFPSNGRLINYRRERFFVWSSL